MDVSLGGHLAFRTAFDARIKATCCFFPTDIHTESLGSPIPSDSLRRCDEITGELIMIFGVNDTHVDVNGRTLIRNRLNEFPITLTFMEVQAGRKLDASSLCVTDHCYRRLHTR